MPCTAPGHREGSGSVAKYIERIADGMLEQKLAGKGAVLVVGPKWCGKTTTAARQAKSTAFLHDPARREAYRLLAQTDPQRLLEGETPRLIDEWQLEPTLWDAARFEIDRRQTFGQFIFTGSATPVDSSLSEHTGTGRFTRMTMRPMTLVESGESTGAVSLAGLFDLAKGETLYAEAGLKLDDLVYLIARGGWPVAVMATHEPAALMQAKDYVEATVTSELPQRDGVQRNPQRLERLLRSYARNTASSAGYTTLTKDISANESDPVGVDTVTEYVGVLKDLYVIEDLAAWNPNLRSRAAIRTSDTRFFVDPSVGVAALGASPGDLAYDLETCGLFFEAMCVRDLRVYAEALGGRVYHYRDSNGLECDAVVHRSDGSYGLIEVKLGGDDAIEVGAASLNKLAATIDTTRMPAPAFRMVLTGLDPLAYTRKDGVHVVPIGCLGA